MPEADSETLDVAFRHDTYFLCEKKNSKKKSLVFI
jgi:hypothetical protein